MIHYSFNTILLKLIVILLSFSSENLLYGQQIVEQPYYLDLSQPLVFQSQVNDHKSLFGWSLTFVRAGGTRDEPNHWLFVGDPEGSVSGINRNVERPGAVWKCSLSGPQVPECFTMDLDSKPCSRPECPGNPFYENRTHMWTGGSLVSNSERFIACAHKWARGPAIEPVMNGLCYWFNINSMYSWTLGNQRNDILQKGTKQEHRLIPFYWESTYAEAMPKQYYSPRNSRDKFPDYAYGEAGFSAYINPENNEAVLGGPGVRVWDGALVRYQDKNKQTSISQRDRLNRGNRNEYAYLLDVKNSHSTNYNYFGYAVTSGRYTRSGEFQYVGSSPRGFDLFGEVTIFSFSPRYQDLDFTTDDIRISGPHFGSYFGYSLLSVDVNNDGLDELFIGTPMYCDDDYRTKGDQGAIFVFGESILRNRRVVEANELIRISSGLKSQARFGFSMISLGDLNDDGYNDVAIGAPFANDNEGAVYIYYGKPNLESAWIFDQRILPRDIYISGIQTPIPVKGFGCSLAVLDIDNNGTPDLGIGSFLSKTVGIFRSRPKLSIVQKIEYKTAQNEPIYQIDANAKEFVVESCIKIQGEVLSTRNINLELEVGFSMDAGQNRFSIFDVTRTSTPLDPGKLKYTTIANTVEYTCKILHATKRKEFGTPDSPHIIPVYFEQFAEYKGKPSNNEGQLYIITNEGPTKTSKRENAIDAFAPTSPFPLRVSHSQELIINTDCRDVNNCESKLRLKTWFEHNTEQVSSVKLEWNQNFIFVIQISNDGEPAYNPEIILQINQNERPKFGFSKECVLNSGGSNNVEMRCLLNRKIERTERGTDKMIRVPFTLNGIYGSISNKKISILTTVGTIKKPNSRATFTAELELIAEAKIQLVGSIKPSPVDISDVFHQDYEVILHGRTPIDTMYFEFKFPVHNRAQMILQIEEPRLTGPKALICKYENFQKLMTPSTTTPTPLDGSGGLDESSVIESRRRRRDTQRSPKGASKGKQSESSKPQRLETIGLNANTTYVGCNDTSSSISCDTIRCEILNVIPPYNEFIVFNMQMNIDLTKSLFEKDKKRLLIESHGEAKILGGYKESQSISQTIVRLDLVGRKEEIPFWIYIVSGVGGIILLILITLCLCKTGFFKRSKKEELQELKHKTEVEIERRKTIMMEQNTLENFNHELQHQE